MSTCSETHEATSPITTTSFAWDSSSATERRMTTLMLALATAFVLLVTCPGPAMVAEAGDIRAFVTDQARRPIEDAVVRAMAVSGTTLPVKPRETVDQINKG